MNESRFIAIGSSGVKIDPYRQATTFRKTAQRADRCPISGIADREMHRIGKWRPNFAIAMRKTAPAAAQRVALMPTAIFFTGSGRFRMRCEEATHTFRSRPRAEFLFSRDFLMFSGRPFFPLPAKNSLDKRSTRLHARTWKTWGEAFGGQ
jgi:hypothetical protein